MAAVVAIEFDSSSSSLLLTELKHKGNVLHTLLVDSVNAKYMDNADMQPSYNENFNAKGLKIKN